MERLSCCSSGVSVKRWVIALLLSGGLCQGAAAADLSRAQKLIEQGDLKQARVLVDEHLASNSGSVEGRFLKGVILARRNESAQAIEIFSQLTRDEPKLLEAYNNLAVLYARQQDYDKARATLEAATRADPTFAAISGNLKATYGWLASRAYDKALGQNVAVAPIPGNMVLLGKLSETSKPKPAPAAPQAAWALAAAKPAAEAQVKSAAATQPPVAVAQVREPASLPKVEAPTKAASAAPAARQSVEAESRPPSNPEADVRRALDDWSAAWERKDMKSYFAAYAADFTPAGGLRRKDWEAERDKRIAKKKGRIVLKMERVRISIKQDVATVQFRQFYKRDDYSDSTHKTMVFSKRGNQWRITSEKVK